MYVQIGGRYIAHVPGAGLFHVTVIDRAPSRQIARAGGPLIIDRWLVRTDDGDERVVEEAGLRPYPSEESESGPAK